VSWEYDFELPFPPSVNGMWRNFRNRQIISKRGREYRERVLDIMCFNELQGENLSGSLSVELILHPPTLRKYDIDNFTKALFDALSKAEFWEDDSQVIRLVIEKGEKIKGGKVVIKVRGI
jgi:crossover junction endodeoxyribonuclease RusA